MITLLFSRVLVLILCFSFSAADSCAAYDAIEKSELPTYLCFKCQDGMTRPLESFFVNFTIYDLPSCSSEPDRTEFVTCFGACLYIDVDRQKEPFSYGRMRDCVEDRGPGRLFATRIKAKGNATFDIGDYHIRMQFCTQPGCNAFFTGESYPENAFYATPTPATRLSRTTAIKGERAAKAPLSGSHPFPSPFMWIPISLLIKLF